MPNFENITALEDLAKSAGEAIMQVFHSGDFGARLKADDSPVSEADMAAHKIIVAGLEKFDPNSIIISEESYKDSDVPPNAWLVDPLDGTKGFLNKKDEFTVNIAYMKNYEPVFGIVYMPTKDKLYVGYDNKAYVQIGDKKQNIKTRKQSQTVIICSSLRHDNETALQDYLLKHDLDKELEFIKIDSSLKFCLVADGTADLYIRLAPTYIWDSAAGDAVLRATGGGLLTPEGAKFTYDKQVLNGGFIAASQELSQKLKG